MVSFALRPFAFLTLAAVAFAAPAAQVETTQALAADHAAPLLHCSQPGQVNMAPAAVKKDSFPMENHGVDTHSYQQAANNAQAQHGQEQMTPMWLIFPCEDNCQNNMAAQQQKMPGSAPADNHRGLGLFQKSAAGVVRKSSEGGPQKSPSSVAQNNKSGQLVGNLSNKSGQLVGKAAVAANGKNAVQIGRDGKPIAGRLLLLPLLPLLLLPLLLLLMPLNKR
ncbi:hypothetical protein DL89DRAFT_264663 [Linderina pennispora]|uniref:Uncharacterized protein n=1 Tax=Linderina pennispora TaxID=61395 RepID=A0A1Y1WMT5_9FUNG|nr:uncharacterized protein DL89DRAFT_264663 [Linderina pennispora]ORX74880.1 hypothetical protein DL89DRAFT_264663 [Linderina pennispora]